MKTTDKLPTGKYGPPLSLDDPHITLGQLQGFANSRGCNIVITMVKARNAAKLIQTAKDEDLRQRAALVKDRDPRQHPHPGDVIENKDLRILVTRVEKKQVSYLAAHGRNAISITLAAWRKLAKGARVLRVVAQRGELHADVIAANNHIASLSQQPIPRLRWPGFQPMIGDIMEHLDNRERREVKELASVTHRLWFQILRKGKAWGSQRYVKIESWREWCKRAKVVRRAEEVGLPKTKPKKR